MTHMDNLVAKTETLPVFHFLPCSKQDISVNQDDHSVKHRLKRMSRSDVLKSLFSSFLTSSAVLIFLGSYPYLILNYVLDTLIASSRHAALCE